MCNVIVNLDSKLMRQPYSYLGFWILNGSELIVSGSRKLQSLYNSANLLYIIKYPIRTSKAIRLMKQKNRFSFAVDSKAEKMAIKFAMEKLFGVKVVSVNTSMLALKKRCVGKIIGKKVRYKRAIIKLGAEDAIRFLDMFYYENPII